MPSIKNEHAVRFMTGKVQPIYKRRDDRSPREARGGQNLEKVLIMKKGR